MYQLFDAMDDWENEEWKAQRAMNEENLRVLRELDIAVFCRSMELQGNGYCAPDVALISLHKVRYETHGIDARLRNESRAWLQKRNYDRLHGEPWPPVGLLPEQG